MKQHSLLIPFRGRARQKALYVLFEQLESMMFRHGDKWEVIFLHASDQCSYYQTIHFDCIYERLTFPLSQPFPKAAMLNHGAKIATGQWLTILDCDCIPQEGFLDGIEQFYDDPENKNLRLAHDVRMLSKDQAEYVAKMGLHWAEDKIKYDTLPKSHEEDLFGCKAGNPRCTLPRDMYLDHLYDERFNQGYGLEDIEWVLRLHHHYGPPIFGETPALLHYWHEQGADWKSGGPETHQKLLDDARANGFPEPPEQKEIWSTDIVPNQGTDETDINYDEGGNPLLSILIPCLNEHKPLLDKLLEVVNPQITAGVELNILMNDGSIPLGELRQKMVQESNGRWIVHIDADDMVTTNYVSSILDAIREEWPDVITYLQDRRFDGRYLGFARYGMSEKWEDKQKGAMICTRPPTHHTPIKREFVEQIGFQPMRRGEDYEFAKGVMELVALGRIRSEVHVNDVMYLYNRRSK